MAAIRLVRDRIDPRITASLFANYRSATDALLELVDNAVDSRIRGQPRLVSRPRKVTTREFAGMPR